MLCVVKWPADGATSGPEAYVNKYRNGWVAAVASIKATVEELKKAKGKKGSYIPTGADHTHKCLSLWVFYGSFWCCGRVAPCLPRLRYAVMWNLFVQMEGWEGLGSLPCFVVCWVVQLKG